MGETRADPPSSACVDSATLAAFIDAQLESAERARVIAHLAWCPDCSELVGEVIAVEEALASEPAPVLERVPAPRPEPVPALKPEPVPQPKKVLWFRGRGLVVVGALTALAASIVLVMLNRGSPLASLVAIVGDERLTVARPTGDFRYGPLRSPMRGSVETASLSLQAEAARLRLRATETGAASDLHAAGIGELLAGDVADAIAALESAARAEPRDATIQADLGAGYMTRFVNTGNQVDGTAALAALDRALELDPTSKEAWFNKAVLLDRLERPADALSAWNGYLALSAEPGWHDEAVRQRDALQRKAR